MIKRKLLTILITFSVVIIIFGAVYSGMVMEKYDQSFSDDSSIQVEMNEVKNLISSRDEEGALRKADEVVEKFGKTDREKKLTAQKKLSLAGIWGAIFISIAGLIVMVIFLYNRILRPFEDMKSFAAKVSKGDLDADLRMDKGNYFGDFTWAFDNMRKEISKSRAAEKTAIENNKTVIASLSHDIKTPIASIRAYSEAFEANMDSTPEKRQKYLGIIMDKCDEVTKLTDDLFLHSVSEMNRLEVKKESFDLVKFMDTEVRNLFTDEESLKLILPKEGSGAGEKLKSIMINADGRRLLQIMENLKNNSDKYAKTKVCISLEELSQSEEKDGDGYKVRIHFRDYGQGISDDEIPFVTGKFYRGKNSGNENGSGLGLYIVKELVSMMNGDLKIFRKDPGLEVTISLR